MRSTWTILGLAASACLTLTPAYADSHGPAAVAAPHAHVPQTTAHPTPAGKPTSTTGTTTTLSTTPPANKTTKKPTSPTSTTTTTLNPIAQKISSHPALAAKVQALLPAGMTLNQASKGFKNQGQFLAALHVSKDLHIPFAQLKAEMTGKDHDSLGMAIQELKPGVDAKVAVSTAESETDADLK